MMNSGLGNGYEVSTKVDTAGHGRKRDRQDKLGITGNGYTVRYGGIGYGLGSRLVW